MRIRPSQFLPRKYAFLTKHSRKSFIIPYTYDFASAPFSTRIGLKHGIAGASIHDMWFAKTISITGNARTDYTPNVEPIYHTPIQIYSGTTLLDTYYLTVDSEYVYIYINHITASTGIYHCYFHVKLYDDEFLADAYIGTVWRSTPPPPKV